ncbi:MAG: nuclear transport factor 2 family protein [Asticcacaulis sp.]
MTPEAIVRGQLEAYNARDIDAFLSFWADDAEIYAHPDTLLAKGHDAIRERHLIRFQEPDLFARLISRTVIDNRVIDIESVTRNFPEGVGRIDVAGIYEIESETIKRAWFLTGAPQHP